MSLQEGEGGKPINDGMNAHSRGVKLGMVPAHKKLSVTYIQSVVHDSCVLHDLMMPCTLTWVRKVCRSVSSNLTMLFLPETCRVVGEEWIIKE